MFINNVSVDRKISYGWSESKSGQQNEETEGDDITLTLVQRVPFPRSNSDLIVTQRTSRNLVLKEPEPPHYTKKEMERVIPRVGFNPQPLQHQYSRPKVGASQVGRNAKHMQFLRSSPTLAELNRQIRKNEAAKSNRCKTSTPRDSTNSSKEEKIELRKLEDLFRVYKGNKELIQRIFPSTSTSYEHQNNQHRQQKAGTTPEPMAFDATRSMTNSPLLTPKPNVLNNPLQIVNYQDKGRAKSAVTQDSYLLRNRPPLSVLNSNSHVPVPLYVPSSATPRKSAQHNMAAYVPQTMAPYLYGIRGRPVNGMDKQYPVSRSSQTSLASNPDPKNLSHNNVRWSMASARREKLKSSYPESLQSPVVPPATPQLDSSASRMDFSNNIHPGSRRMPDVLLGENLPIHSDSKLGLESREESTETRHPTTPRQGFSKQQSHVRFLLDDDNDKESDTQQAKNKNTTEKAPKRASDQNPDEDDDKSEIDSVDEEAFPNNPTFQPPSLSATNNTITSRIESGASLPVEVYDVNKL
ncbi:uncharacterized protein LOC142336867 isoform X2 [Convolutriloba macropyga]|uniref:uncharacterized protein LOC142336867 isoform X2 n=1 Tax=Convolutriloba macropyga TaxID=536237 RepID=UPI003F523B43